MKPKLYEKLLWVVGLALLLSACGGTAEETQALPTLATTAVAVQPNETASRTPPPTPPITAIIPATETAAPSPTLTPSPTPTPTATPTPVFLNEPADFGDDRNPLTGELVSDPELLNRRPLLVKIANAPARIVRPQAGLNSADLVIEYLTEGSVTRFSALFYSQTPPDMGPIRSARLVDIQLVHMFDAALIYSGASGGVRPQVNDSINWARNMRGGNGYYRISNSSIGSEHTLFGVAERFWEQLAERGHNGRPNFRNHLTFSDIPPAGGIPARQIEIDYRSEFVRWEYDEAIGRYRRWADNEALIDKNDDEQITAANVIVLYAAHILDPSTCQVIEAGTCPEISFQIQLWGSGTAILFRDGQRYNGVWRRNQQQEILTFYDSSGAKIPLQIGNSWLQIVPPYAPYSVRSIE